MLPGRRAALVLQRQSRPLWRSTSGTIFRHQAYAYSDNSASDQAGPSRRTTELAKVDSHEITAPVPLHQPPPPPPPQSAEPSMDPAEIFSSSAPNIPLDAVEPESASYSDAEDRGIDERNSMPKSQIYSAIGRRRRVESRKLSATDQLTRTEVALNRLWGRYEKYRSALHQGSSQKYDTWLNIVRGLLDGARMNDFLLRKSDEALVRRIRHNSGVRVLRLLDHLEEDLQKGLVVDERQAFAERCSRVEATGLTEGVEVACDLFDDVMTDFKDDVATLASNLAPQGARKNHPIRRGREVLLGTVEGLAVSAAEEEKDETVKMFAIGRILRWRSVNQVIRLANSVPRTMIYRPIACLKLPIETVRRTMEFAKTNNANAVSEAITTILLALIYSKRIIDAYHLFIWADRNRVIFDERVASQMMRSLTYEGLNEMADEVGPIVQAHVAAKGGRVLGRSTLQLFAWHCAKLGEVELMEKALSGIDLHYHQDEFVEHNRNIEYDLRIFCAAQIGDVDECVALLRRKFDIEEFVFDLVAEQGEQTQNDDGFRLMPSSERLRSLVIAFINADLVHEAETIIKRIINSNGSIHSSLLDSLLSAYVKRGDLASSISLFDEMAAKKGYVSRRTINTMILHFARNNDVDGAIKMLLDCEKFGIRPNRHMYNTLLQAHLESQSWGGAVALFRLMHRAPNKSVRPDAISYNIMLNLHVQRPMPIQLTYKFFRHMLEAGFMPSAHTFTVLMLSATDAGLTRLAEDVFSVAERRLGGRRGHEAGKGANSYHFTVMIKHYLDQGHFAIAKEYISELVKRGLPISGVLRGIIVEAFAKAQGEEESVGVAQQLAANYVQESAKDFLAIYQPLMTRAARAGQAEVVEGLIRDAISRSIEIPMQVWTSLLNALRRQDNDEGALKLWELIFSKTKQRESQLCESSPTFEKRKPTDVVSRSRRHVLSMPLSIVIDTLTRAGRFEEVARVWMECRSAGFGFNSHNWNQLVVSLLHARRVEDAFNIIERILDQDPPHLRSHVKLFDVEEKIEQALDRASEAKDDEEAAITLPPLEGQAEILFGDRAGERTSNRNQRQDRPRFPNDDPYTPLPEGLEDGAAMLSIEEEERKRLEKTLRPLEARRLMENVFSPWFAHFETMHVLTDVVTEARQRGGRFGSRIAYEETSAGDDVDESDDVDGANAGADAEEGMTNSADGGGVEWKKVSVKSTSVNELLLNHPRVEELLLVHERRVEHLREQQMIAQRLDQARPGELGAMLSSLAGMQGQDVSGFTFAAQKTDEVFPNAGEQDGSPSTEEAGKAA